MYVERNANPATNPKHGGAYFVDLYIPVKNGDKMYTLRIVAEDTNLAPDEYEIRDVDLYDIYKIREIPRTSANAGGTHSGQLRGISPDTITVAEMLNSVKGRDGELLVNEDGTLNTAPYTDEELEAKIKEVPPNAQNWKRTETGVEFNTPNGMHWRYDYFSLAGWANYYIRSALAQPRPLEKAVNTLCNRIPMFKELFSDPNGGRGTRAVASDITSVMSAMKLGFFNASSAALNVFQICNLPGYIGYKATLAGVKHALHPSEADKRVLEAANVAEDIGLDSVDGISKLLKASRIVQAEVEKSRNGSRNLFIKFTFFILKICESINYLSSFHLIIKISSFML